MTQKRSALGVFWRPPAGKSARESRERKNNRSFSGKCFYWTLIAAQRNASRTRNLQRAMRTSGRRERGSQPPVCFQFPRRPERIRVFVALAGHIRAAAAAEKTDQNLMKSRILFSSSDHALNLFHTSFYRLPSNAYYPAARDGNRPIGHGFEFPFYR